MANVLTIIKVVPSDPNVDREKFVEEVLIEGVCKECNVEFLKYDEEPLAFGVYAIKAYMKNADTEQGSEDISKLQELLDEREDVGNVEMDMQTLMDH